MVDIQKIAKLFASDCRDAIDYISTCTANAKNSTNYPDDYKIVYDYIKIVQSENTTERYMYTQKFVLDHGQKMLIDLCCAIDDIGNPRPVVKNNGFELTSEEISLLTGVEDPIKYTPVIKESSFFNLSISDGMKEYSKMFHIGPDKQIMFNI